MPKRKINPTIKQKKAFDKIIENHGNVSRAMIEVGYDKTTAINPKNLTESEGYQLLLKEAGLTKDLIAKSLVADIKKKPQRRVKELGLGADILGMRKASEEREPPVPELHLHLHQSPKVVQIIKNAEDELLKEIETND